MNEYYNNGNYTTEPTPKNKKGKLGTAAALVIAVTLAGLGSGFLGANLAMSSPAEFPTAQYEQSQKNEKSPGNAVKDDKQEISGDAAAAIEALNNSSVSPSGSGTNSSGEVRPTGPDGQYTAAELYEAVNDTIVLINVYKSQSSYSSGYYDYYFGYGDKEEKDKEPVFVGYGSGIIFTEDGYILTNDHVVEGADKLEIVVNDYEDHNITHTYEAKVIGSDDKTDIAIVKIGRAEPFKAAAIGDSDTLKVGQDVCAIGNPGVSGTIMFSHTMTKGIISGLERVSLSSGYTTSYIQTDTAVNGGNSGGALFDMYGNVVGVVNRKIVVENVENIGFAITINEAKPVMEDLISYGYVKNRPVLGITTLELNEYRAQSFGTKLSRGLLVTDIREDAAVSKSNLRINDIITKVNGKNVETVTDVQGIIKNMRAGDKVTVTVARENEKGTVDSVDIEIELSESTN